MLAAEREVQLAVVAPPRSGKSTGYVIPWLLDHTGPALVLSVKRDVYDATVAHRRRLGRVWVYDPFGPESCSFSPLCTADTWEGAIRAALALAGAARNDHASAATDFWDREAAVLLAPLMHAATVGGHTMATVLQWLDSRDYGTPAQLLANIGAETAKTQLLGILARDPRNRETTVMSAAALLRAYRYPRVTQERRTELSPALFFSGSGANTIYVVAAAHHQRDLQPVILGLVAAIYETAIDHARTFGPFSPELYLLLDEAANIAPVRDLPMWLSQCGDHGITIATSWQSIAQIDARYGRHERDAIMAASTAQLFLPPLADPTTTEYVTGLLGKEPVGQASHGHGLARQETVAVSEQNVADTARLRQVQSERALLVYRDLPPAIVRAPRWYRDPRFAAYRSGRRLLNDRPPALRPSVPAMPPVRSRARSSRTS
jgi:type IV secretory pathway TraG/TraD family ATPase VirD4